MLVGLVEGVANGSHRGKHGTLNGGPTGSAAMRTYHLALPRRTMELPMDTIWSETPGARRREIRFERLAEAELASVGLRRRTGPA